jgi:hypothetical protein
MASGANFTAAINALVAERDRVFLERVSQDYNLPIQELQKKYMETAEQAIKVPRQYKKREPKSVSVVAVTEGGEVAKSAPKVPKAKAEKQCCTSQTSKKEPCKFAALKGEVFCKRHLKQQLGEASPEAPKPAKKASKKAEQPVHTHDLTENAAGECDLCESHGNPLEATESAFEVVRAPAAGPVKQLTAEQRLAALLADSDDVEEEAFESDEDALMPLKDADVEEEAFEDDKDEDAFEDDVEEEAFEEDD